MLNSTSSTYARLPPFSAIIDGLASGLGVVRNKEDALANLGSFSGRIDAYSGSSHRSGLEGQLLKLLVGSNETLQGLVQARLLDAEAALTNARSLPLVTDAAEVEGQRHFIEIWAVPWIAQILMDARQYPESVLDGARLLLEMHAASLARESISYLQVWKAAVRKSIPEGVVAREFRTTLTKLDQRSRRKITSIEQDLANLHVEMQNGHLSTQEFNAAISAIRRLYLAGMATMRLCSMAVDIISEQDLLALVFNALTSASDDGNKCPEEEEAKRIYKYWSHLGALALSNKYERLSSPNVHQDALSFDKLRTNLRVMDPAGLLTPAIDFSEGAWHLFHGQGDLAKRCLQRVIVNACGRQLGEIAACAASILVALRISEQGSLKFEELNPLMRVRIDNMPQLEEVFIDAIPTPFSDFSSRPEPSFYASHLMQCVKFFNNFSRSLNASISCNPLVRFDAGVEELIVQSQVFGAKMTEGKRNLLAIAGTSVRPYEVLRDHFYYRDALFGFNPSNLPGMDMYMMISRDDQLRVLRFVDPEQFQLDLKKHGITEWHHPNDLL